MKWGRKNSPSSKPKAKANGGGGSGMSSWISKIKQISGNSKSPPPTKTKQKIKVSSSPLYAAAAAADDEKEEEEEEEEEEAYWRLSFGKENFKGKKSTTTTTTTHVLGSVWFGSDGECERECNDHRSRSNTSTTQSFTSMVSDVRKTKELLTEKHRGEEIVLETPRRKIQKGRKVIIRKSRRTDRRNLEDVYSDSGRDDLIEVNLEPIKTTKNQNCNVTYSNSRKSHYIPSSNLNRIEIEKPKKSIDQRRTSKLRSYYSPRTPSKVEIIKIRAIEEMKKSKLKKKKKKKKEEMEMEMEMQGRRRRGLESCAMVKCSYDPQNDFRESMVEMILEKNIRRSEELEELLACYLTLNSDEYHDLIIKVFKQVWFDLNRFSFSPSPELENQVLSY